MSQNVGTLITSAIRSNDSLDAIATAFGNEIKGGHHGYATLSERNSIISERREWGMFCAVYNDGANNGIYHLKYNYSNTTITDNSNWILFSGSSNGGGSIYWGDPVKSVLKVQPSTASVGDRYLVGLSSADVITGSQWGAFSSGGNIVQWNSTLNSWDVTVPLNGVSIRVNSEDDSIYRYEGTYSTGTWYKEKINQVRGITASSSNATTYAATSNGLLAYDVDSIYLVTFATANSGSTPTLNINGLGAKVIKQQTNSGLSNFVTGDINTSVTYTVLYDGTYFRLTKPFTNPSFIQYRINSGETVVVDDYKEYLLYGDLEVKGNLNLGTYSKMVILNGNLNMNGGTVSNSSNIEFVKFITTHGGSQSYLPRWDGIGSLSATSSVYDDGNRVIITSSTVSVNGKLFINDGTQGFGKYLQSGTSGDTSWVTLVVSSGTNTGDETATSKQTFIDALTVSPAPLDTMMVQVTDPASTTVKKFSWANFKTYLLAYFDTLYPRKTVASTGSVISFDAPVIWNTVASPSTSNLTDDLNNAKIGYIQKIYHNKAVEPTYPAGWVKMGTGTYTNGVLNVIFAEWVSGTRVEYWITKPA